MNDLDITNRTIEAFTMYKFLDEITKNFTEFDSYRRGLIDEEGYFKTNTERIPTFELFVIYIKRLLNQITNPATTAQLHNLSSAMTLFKESLEDYGLRGEVILEYIIEELVEEDLMEQEVASGLPANNVGSNNIAGIPASIEFIQDDEGFDNLVFRRRKKKKDEKNPCTNMARRKSAPAPVGRDGY